MPDAGSHARRRPRTGSCPTSRGFLLTVLFPAALGTEAEPVGHRQIGCEFDIGPAFRNGSFYTVKMTARVTIDAHERKWNVVWIFEAHNRNF